MSNTHLARPRIVVNPQTLLAELEHLACDVDRSARMERMDDFQRAAMDLLASGEARLAFDLSLEPESTRSMYGSHRWGQMALLVFVRRLVWPVTKP